MSATPYASRGPGGTNKGVRNMLKQKSHGIKMAVAAGNSRAATKNQVMMQRRFYSRLAELAWQNAELQDKLKRDAETMAALTSAAQGEVARGRDLYRLVVAAVLQHGDEVRDPASGRAVSWELDLSGAAPSDAVLVRARVDVTADYHIKLTFREADKDG